MLDPTTAAVLADASPAPSPASDSGVGRGAPHADADAAVAAADAALAPFFGDAPAEFNGADAVDDDDDGGSDGGGGAQQLTRRALAARRLAAVRRLHAAYARHARLLQAAAKAGAGAGSRAAGCPSDLDPAPRPADGATAAERASGPAPPLAAAPAGWRPALAAATPRLARLEAAAARAAAADLDRRGGLALLLGRAGAATLRAPVTSLGRGDGVDVDWGALDGAAAARGVSRRQACVELTARGAFVVTNTGRRALAVNGAPLAPGEAAELAPLALVEAGAARCLFVPSARAAARATARSAALAL